jgi:hypothetical protein
MIDRAILLPPIASRTVAQDESMRMPVNKPRLPAARILPVEKVTAAKPSQHLAADRGTDQVADINANTESKDLTPTSAIDTTFEDYDSLASMINDYPETQNARG